MKVEDLEVEIAIALQSEDEEPLCSLSDIEDWIYAKSHELGSTVATKVASKLYPDSHRWYEVATDVYKCDDGYLGVRAVGKLYSESMTYSDCGYDVDVFPMYKYVIDSYTSDKNKALNTWKVPTILDIAKYNFADEILGNEEIKKCIESRSGDGISDLSKFGLLIKKALKMNGFID